MGTDKVLYELVIDLLREFIEGAKGMTPEEFKKYRFNWADAEQKITLRKMNTERLEVHKKTDEVWELQDYIDTNGCEPEAKGHKRVMDEGVPSVLVPLVQRKRIRHLTLLDAQTASDITDNALCSNADMLQMQANAIDSFGMPTSTGMKMKAIAASGAAPAPLPQSAPPAPITDAALAVPLLDGDGDGDTNCFGLGMTPLVVCTAVPEEKAEAEKAAASSGTTRPATGNRRTKGAKKMLTSEPQLPPQRGALMAVMVIRPQPQPQSQYLQLAQQTVRVQLQRKQGGHPAASKLF